MSGAKSTVKLFCFSQNPSIVWKDFAIWTKAYYLATIVQKPMSILTKLFGDPNVREVTKLRKVVDQVTALGPTFQALTDEALKMKTQEFRDRLQKGETLDQLTVEAFAAVREAARRVIGQRHYDVQLIGALALHRGTIAEMRTGEGKTLTATPAVYLNALTGKGVHVVTVNDYLSRRDGVWMGQVYQALGMTVSCVQHAGSFLYDPNFKQEPEHDKERDATGSFRVDMDYLRPVTRKEAYQADITYGTNNEFGFDYLRDNMVHDLHEMVQRPLHYAVVDEVDSILIDEARTPLIISAPAEEPGALYYRFAELVTTLDPKEDYKIDEKARTVAITESGVAKMEQGLGIENLYIQGGIRLVHHLEQALRAHALFKIDRDYVVKDGEVIIVDEFTGRLMQGRRYSEGLHQAIEAKERVKIQRESVTMATVTFQNYFRLYEKLAGMTGTAATEAEEFHKIYKLEVLAIPTHRENKRKDLRDRVYKSELGKFQAVVREIKERHTKGQPVLVGTASIEKNEVLSELLRQAGIPHNVLNAKNHEREAEIIAQAGRPGSVTIATNMAGRGVDIILGGNPAVKEDTDKVRELGGLFVLGTERHESRRIDNQLRGRAGRQGDPGETQFYVSMEDDLMRIFGSDRIKNMMERLGLPDDEAIENGLLSKSIEQAQRKVEGHNFDIRKHLLEYDDVLNKHRMVIYKKRYELLDLAKQPTVEGKRPLTEKLFEAIESDVEQLVAYHTGHEDVEQWEFDKIEEQVKVILPEQYQWKADFSALKSELNGKEDVAERRTKLIEIILSVFRDAYDMVHKTIGDFVMMEEVEKAVMLRTVDDLWIEHLQTMDYLRHSIGLQSYGQRDPLVEYKKESYRLFNEMNANINSRVTRTIFKIQLAKQEAEKEIAQEGSALSQQLTLEGPQKEGDDQVSVKETAQDVFKEVGRNDPCTCGSGKKYKKCHGS